VLNLYAAGRAYLKEGWGKGGGIKTKKDSRFSPNASLSSLLLCTVCKIPVGVRKPTKET
jgi:hypothetical protein